MKRTSNSTLWLLKFPKEAVKRLIEHAKKQKLDDKELVMSSLLPIDSHLGIKAVADFGLDTVMFNGHTTAADTLWSGLPLISQSGELCLISSNPRFSMDESGLDQAQFAFR